jgi:hypothetical protein
MNQKAVFAEYVKIDVIADISSSALRKVWADSALDVTNDERPMTEIFPFTKP